MCFCLFRNKAKQLKFISESLYVFRPAWQGLVLGQGQIGQGQWQIGETMKKRYSGAYIERLTNQHSVALILYSILENSSMAK